MIRAFQKGFTPITKIQIFGERCSGTNFLESLLKENIRPDILTWEFGWKHWFCRDTEARSVPECLFLVLYRHPIEWLQSLHRKPWHVGPELRDLAFEEFIRREWHSVYDEDSDIKPGDALWYQDIEGDLEPDTGKRFKNVLANRNAKVRHWENLRKRFDNVCYLRYEDLRADPETLIRIITARYGFACPRDFRSVSGYKGVGDTWAPRRYDPLPRRERLYLCRTLDLWQEHRIGYPPLSILRDK